MTNSVQPLQPRVDCKCSRLVINSFETKWCGIKYSNLKLDNPENQKTTEKTISVDSQLAKFCMACGVSRGLALSTNATVRETRANPYVGCCLVLRLPGSSPRIKASSLSFKIHESSLSRSLKDVRIVVPADVRQGDDAVLQCLFDLEGDSLYSVKWYKGQNEFYRFTPREEPSMKVFPLHGLKVDRLLFVMFVLFVLFIAYMMSINKSWLLLRRLKMQSVLRGFDSHFFSGGASSSPVHSPRSYAKGERRAL
ncbi:hypothetical protein B566_EDAN005447 [Ephemera danica]|nr:hypothetical protein B566_EDAN005447 [Ephemera danica]